MPRVVKRSAEKISDLDEVAREAQKVADKMTAGKKLELEKNLERMKDDAEARRLSVLNDYLKENQGKTIVVTKPPPKIVKTIPVLNKKSPEVVKKKTPTPKKVPIAKAPKNPPATAITVKAVKVKSATKAPKPPATSSVAGKGSSSIVLPKKLASFDEAQLLHYLNEEIGLTSHTSIKFKKEQVDGKYLRGLWLHRNDEGTKDRIADIFEKIVPDDKDFALLLNLLSSGTLRL
jgi:hypothetical protein